MHKILTRVAMNFRSPLAVHVTLDNGSACDVMVTAPVRETAAVHEHFFAPGINSGDVFRCVQAGIVELRDGVALFIVFTNI